MSIDVDITATERKALANLGWPPDRMYSSKAKVLALLATDPDLTEADAYRLAGVNPTTARAWKSKAAKGIDAIYGECLARATRRPSPERTDRPWPGNLDTPTLKARAAHTDATLRDLGNGPWRKKDSIYRSIHAETRSTLIAYNNELRQRGLPTFDVPPEAAPLPKKRFRHPILRSVG